MIQKILLFLIFLAQISVTFGQIDIDKGVLTECSYSGDFTITPTEEWQLHSSSVTEGSCKTYKIFLTEGMEYHFKTGCDDGATADFNTKLTLFNSYWTTIHATSDDYCEEGRSYIVWEVSYTDYYYLRVEGSGYYNNYGDYTLAYGFYNPDNPCNNIITIAGTGSQNAKTFVGGGTGQWNHYGDGNCGYWTSGVEQIYEFTAPFTANYSLQVTSANVYVDYLWQTGDCSIDNWTCIDDIDAPGTYGNLNFTAGQTYYIILDYEYTGAGSHTFYINCPTPTAPTVTASEGTYCDKVIVTWNSVSGATSYDVYKESTFLTNTTSTTYTDFSAGTFSTAYNIYAKNSCGTSAKGTDWGYRNTTPSAPTITASDGTYCDKVDISWNAVSGAASYDVYRDNTFLTNTTITSYSDYSANSISTVYKVYSKNICGNSAAGTDTGFKKGTPASPSVTATDGSYCDKVVISWNSITGASSYDVYRGTTFLVNTGSITFEDYSAPSTSIIYNVYAKNNCGISAAGSDGGFSGGTLTAPTVSASDGSFCDKVEISWNSVAGAASYDVYKNSSFLTNTNLTSYNDVSSNPSPVYFSVYAKNSCSTSTAGTDSGFTGGTLTAPTVSASDGTFCDKVEISWNSVSGAESYDVYKNSSLLTNTNITSYNDVSSNPLPVNYSVYAKNGCSTSSAGTDAGNTCNTVNVERIDNQLYKIYPNPNNGKFIVEANSNYIGIIIYEISDITGKKLLTEKTNKLTGNQKINIEIDNLSKGIYIIKLSSENEVITKQIIVE